MLPTYRRSAAVTLATVVLATPLSATSPAYADPPEIGGPAPTPCAAEKSEYVEAVSSYRDLAASYAQLASIYYDAAANYRASRRDPENISARNQARQNYNDDVAARVALKPGLAQLRADYLASTGESRARAKEAYRAALAEYDQRAETAARSLADYRSATNQWNSTLTPENRQILDDAKAELDQARPAKAAAKTRITTTRTTYRSCLTPPPPTMSITGTYVITSGLGILGTIHATRLKASTRYFVSPEESCAALGDGKGCGFDSVETTESGTFDGLVLLDSCGYVPSRLRTMSLYEDIAEGLPAENPTVSVAIDFTDVCGPY